MLRICSLILVSVTLANAEPVDWLLTARYVIAMDANRQVIEYGAVAVKGQRIMAVGTEADLASRYQPKQRIARPNAIIAPGLINTHTHAAMSLFRGLADDRRLQDWLENYIFPAEAKNVSPDFVRWGTRLACLEMLLSGTTTFTDGYYFEDVVAEAAKEAGMRGVLGETVIGFPVADAKTPADALKFTEKFLIRFHNDPLITPAVAPHAIYTNSDDTLRAARALANKYNAPLIMHVSETKKENDDVRAKRGVSPVQALDAIGFFDGRTLIAHGVWLDDADIRILKKHGTGVAHCPSSNMKLSSGAAPVLKMIAGGLNVGLGPDGPAGSNNDFDLFEEMDLAAKLQKLVTMDPQSLPAPAALEMATISGARALGLGEEIGSLEPGKRADLITVSLQAPNALPLYNVYSQMVYTLKGFNVNDVMIDGKPIVINRRVLTLNATQITAKANEYADQVRRSLLK